MLLSHMPEGQGESARLPELTVSQNSKRRKPKKAGVVGAKWPFHI